ncbi:hypothetical protein Q0590_03945 [Rhodocytophaga aerolata]|uniref:Aromatic hydrocarbon degradation protein n=1 Tax=Rhodocytophaga aerolata TaxID=455078 RepID=A0ABT8QZW4_9BACT|nr:hypothetical protein [Rhodocytophaga aerolata]MDO1445387.1 hypothetical protein [Rhodocytophaga aerolata]
MHKRLIIASIGILLPVLASYAQTAEDALLFSNTSVNGTARFQGMGGAQTALGADISSISGNPAGLGFFRKSEWSITPSIGFSNTQSNYLNTVTSDGKSYLNVANMGIVFAKPKDAIVGGKWRGGAFGISFNRMSSYQRQVSYQGVNNVNSLLDSFTDQATGITLGDFEGSLGPPRLQAAFDTYLINPFSNDINEDRWFSSIGEIETSPGQYIQAPVQQNETINYTGARNQWNLSYGGNYDDKLYFGASVGISNIRFGQQNRYREVVQARPEDLIVDNFTLTEDIDVRGTGVNLTAGIIYKANDIIRFGASFTSPTWYRLTDNYIPRIQANFEYPEFFDPAIERYQDKTIEVEPLRYNLTTPLSISGGLALFAGKNGFITADVTYSTYNSIRFGNSNEVDFGSENEFISRNYQPTVNARIGGEFRKDIFRLRAGAGYQTDPYKDLVDDLNRQVLNFSAGAGIRLPEFYIDLAVVHNRFDNGYTPYTISNQATPSVIIKNRLTNAVLSFGMFF